MWQAIGLVTGGVSLLAFLAAVASAWHSRIEKQRLEAIRTLQGGELLDALDTVLVGLRVPHEGLTGAQKFKLAQQRLRESSRRYTTRAVTTVVLTVIAAGVAVYAIGRAVDEPSQVQHWNDVMVANFQQGQYEGAAAQADKILQEDANHARALSVKGSVAAFDGDYRTAVRFFRRAYELLPDNYATRRNLAYALLNIGNVQEALDHYTALRNGSRSADYSLAIAHVAAGHFDAAISILEQLPAAADPGSPGQKAGQRELLHAAALMGRQREGDRLRAKAKLQFAIAQAPEYWKPILYNGERDPQNDYRYQLKLLAPFLTQPAPAQSSEPATPLATEDSRR